MATNVVFERKLRDYNAIAAEYAKSKSSIVEICKKLNLSKSTYYYVRNKLKEQEGLNTDNKKSEQKGGYKENINVEAEDNNIGERLDFIKQRLAKGKRTKVNK